MRIALLAIAVLAAVVPCQPADAQPSAHTRTAARLDSLARAFVTRTPAPGLAVVVLRGNDTLLARGYGYADLEDRAPATPRTVFRIGSVTKQFTAALVMQLVQEGRIALDDTIQRFLPDYPVQGHRVTIRHLLTHTAGIKAYTSLPDVLRLLRTDLSEDSLVAMFASKPFDFAPGDRYRYNNSGYYLLGVIVERVTGRPYDELLRERLFQPLGLLDTRYCSTRPVVRRRAQGYANAPEGFVNAEWISMTLPFAAGAICSTALDLATWTRALWAGRVVAPASLREMTTPARLNSGASTGYGFGLGMDSLAGHYRVSHGGSINGFRAYLAHFPDDDLTIAVLDNSENTSPQQLADRLARVALGVPLPLVRDLPLTAAERARYVGSYALGQTTVRVLEQGDALATESGQGVFRLRSLGQHVFVPTYDDSARIEFEVSSDRATGFTINQDGVARHATRVN